MKIAGFLGPKQVKFHLKMTKQKYHVPTANKQVPILMHLEHKFSLPSLIGAMRIKKKSIFKRSPYIFRNQECKTHPI